MKAYMLTEYERRHLEQLEKIAGSLMRIANAMEGTEFAQLEEIPNDKAVQDGENDTEVETDG